jgi:CTP synthase (UTP-ammonia lyase)
MPSSPSASTAQARLARRGEELACAVLAGAGLRVVAHAVDGTAEAIEDRGRELFLGVQWHAESLADRPEHGALFAALVDAAAQGSERALRLAA